MEIRTITYGQTKNTGNYNSSRLEVSVELTTEDDTMKVLEKLKALVKTELNKEASNDRPASRTNPNF